MSATRPRVLLQTTIPFTADDWHIGRFSLLATLQQSDFDQVWIFAVDTGAGITKTECGAITRFREGGGHVFVTRDHMDLGVSVCDLGGIGDAHYFHSKNLDPDRENRVNDDRITTAIQWPNYYSGPNGDVQTIAVVEPAHPVLAGVKTLPSHPHEGAVGAPASQPDARVVVRSTSKQSRRPFNVAVAFDGHDGSGRGWAESTFHHFCDYNWDVGAGCPSFVGEPPSDAIAKNPRLLDDTKRYVLNLVSWLGSRTDSGKQTRI